MRFSERQVEKTPRQSPEDFFWQAREELFDFFEREQIWINGGELSGFILGVKPAVTVHFKDKEKSDFNKVEELDNVLKSLGEIKVISSGNELLIVNLEAVENRLREEKSFAQELGWDFDVSIDENIERLRSKNHTGRVGFILGYPKSAIKIFRQEGKIARKFGREVVIIYSLLRQYNLFKINPEDSKINFSDWSQEDLDFMDSLDQKEKENSSFLKDEIQEDDDNILKRKQAYFNQKLKSDNGYKLREVYKRYLGFTDDEFEVIMKCGFVDIYNSLKELVFSFVSELGQDGTEPADVQALRAKVDLAFARLRD